MKREAKKIEEEYEVAETGRRKRRVLDFLLQNPMLFCFWPVWVGTGPLKSLHLDITDPVLRSLT